MIVKVATPLTAPSVTGENLRKEVIDYAAAFQKLVKLKEFQKINLGYIRKLEVTYNKEIESWEDINLVKASLYEYIKERLEKDGRKSIRANYDSKSIKKAKVEYAF